MKSSKLKNMCVGNPLSLIFFFSLPLMLGNIFQQLYTIMDTVIVSQKLGVDALAALGSCDWLNWLGFGIITGFAQGFSIMVSQAFGSGKDERVKDSIFSMLVSCAVVTVIFVLISIPLLKQCLIWLNTPNKIFYDALGYTRIIYLGLPITMFYNAMASILRALGNSRTPLYAMVAASIINIVLDIIFVFYLNMGINGAAIATLIAQMIAGIYCLLFLLRFKQFIPNKIHKDKITYRKMYRLGTPMALQNVLISIGGMVLTGVVNQYGTLFLAGFTAVNKLYGILEVSAVSYGYAIVTYVGQNYGAKKYDRIFEGVKKAVLLSVITAILIAILLFLFGKVLLSFFISTNSNGYKEVMAVANSFLSIMAFFLPVLYILHIYRSALQGLSDTFIPMLSGMFELIVRIASALILPIYLHQQGLYPVEVLAWFGAVILLVPSYYHKEKKLKGLIYEKNNSVH